MLSPLTVYAAVVQVDPPSVDASITNVELSNVSVVCSASLKFSFNVWLSTLALVNVGAVISAVPFTTVNEVTSANAFSAFDASVIKLVVAE